MLETLRIDDTGVPIYVQIRDQMLAAIAAGRIAPGARLPTMRQVAVALRVDLNTVRHAYDQLERRGVVVLLRGRGSFVTSTGGAVQIFRARSAEPVPDLDAAAVEALAGFAAAGLDPAQVAHRILVLARGQPADNQSTPKEGSS